MDIEAEYNRRIDAMTPTERLQRAAGMLDWARRIMASQVIQELGDLDPEGSSGKSRAGCMPNPSWSAVGLRTGLIVFKFEDFLAPVDKVAAVFRAHRVAPGHPCCKARVDQQRQSQEPA